MKNIYHSQFNTHFDAMQIAVIQKHPYYIYKHFNEMRNMIYRSDNEIRFLHSIIRNLNHKIPTLVFMFLLGLTTALPLIKFMEN